MNLQAAFAQMVSCPLLTKCNFLPKLNETIVFEVFFVFRSLSPRSVAISLLGSVVLAFGNKEFYPELRDFLRYLLVQGYAEKDFSTLVPKFNRGVRVPETYDVSEITEIENAVDRTSSPGKRDYAILLLASRLGIRAGDIASLKLNSLLSSIGVISILPLFLFVKLYQP